MSNYWMSSGYPGYPPGVTDNDPHFDSDPDGELAHQESLEARRWEEEQKELTKDLDHWYSTLPEFWQVSRRPVEWWEQQDQDSQWIEEQLCR